jgi:hypothetical protein
MVRRGAFGQILSEDSAELLRLAQLGVATDDNMDIVIMPCCRDQRPRFPMTEAPGAIT